MTPSMLDPEPTAKLAFQWELKRIGVFLGGGGEWEENRRKV